MKYIIVLALMYFDCYSIVEQIKSDFYLSQGMINKADQLMNAHLADHATDPQWLYNTAQCSYATKDYDHAHFLFKQAAYYDNNNKRGIALKALYQAGNSAVSTHNLEQALKHFEGVIEYVPEHKEALLMIESLKKALEKKESNNDQKKNDDHNNSESKQEESQSNQASNEDQNKENNSTKQQHDDSSSKNDINNNNNSNQQKKQEQPSDTTPYTPQDAQKLKEQLEKQQDDSIGQNVSAQQLRLLKHVEEADKNAQKVMLQQSQSKSTKGNAHEHQW